jgi:hypothetical protein
MAMTVKEREDGLAVLIRARVERLAGGRIRDLDVACEGGRVVLKGRSRTQYAKQMALQAALDLAGDRPALANRIEVR